MGIGEYRGRRGVVMRLMCGVRCMDWRMGKDFMHVHVYQLAMKMVCCGVDMPQRER